MPAPARPTSKMKDRKAFKVTLKLSGARPNKTKVFETLGKLQVFLTNLHEIPTGYTAITDSQTQAEGILNLEGSNALKAINLTPVMPPSILALRTLTLKSLAEYVTDKTADEIAAEIMAKNSSCRTSTKVIKLPNARRVIKIITPNTTVAKKLLEDGVTLFNTRVPPHNISQEKYAHVNACMKCYQLEKHNTKACPSKTKVCSECAATGHTFKECTEALKKCLNCTRDGKTGAEANHRTLAAKCPLMKKAMHAKIQLQSNPPQKQQPTHHCVPRQPTQQKTMGRTYAAAARGTARADVAEIPTVVLAEGVPPLPGRTLNLTQVCIAVSEAFMAAVISGKPTGEVVSDAIKKQFDIEMTFPNRDLDELIDFYHTSSHGTRKIPIPAYPQADNGTPATPPDEEDVESMDVGDVHLNNKRVRSPSPIPEKTKTSPENRRRSRSSKTKKTKLSSTPTAAPLGDPSGDSSASSAANTTPPKANNKGTADTPKAPSKGRKVSPAATKTPPKDPSGGPTAGTSVPQTSPKPPSQGTSWSAIVNTFNSKYTVSTLPTIKAKIKISKITKSVLLKLISDRQLSLTHKDPNHPGDHAELHNLLKVQGNPAILSKEQISEISDITLEMFQDSWLDSAPNRIVTNYETGSTLPVMPRRQNPPQ